MLVLKKSLWVKCATLPYLLFQIMFFYPLEAVGRGRETLSGGGGGGEWDFA